MDKLTELLTVLAEKLGTTTEYLFSVLIKQTQVVFYQNIIWIFVIMLFIIAYFIYAKYCHKNWKVKIYDDDSEVGHTALLIIGGGAALFSIIVITSLINEMITIQANPEYWALKEILNSI